MSQSVIRLTREQLYKEVWSRPVWSLAKEWGISDVGLAKICKRNNIPRPGLGYWAKRQAGLKVKQIPLPKEDYIGCIDIRGHRLDDAAGNQRSTSFKASKPLRRQLRSIVVSRSLTEPHPLVKQTAEVLGSLKPSKIGILNPPLKQSLNIEVSPANLKRALRVMDTLIKALEEMGWRVFLTKNSTDVSIQGVSVGIGLREELTRKRKDPRDHNLEGYYEFGFSRYATEPVPSGKLYLTIDDPDFVYSDGNRGQHWMDTKSTRLEESLGNFIVGILRAVHHKGNKTSAEATDSGSSVTVSPNPDVTTATTIPE
jgi:hypothetical protein